MNSDGQLDNQQSLQAENNKLRVEIDQLRKAKDQRSLGNENSQLRAELARLRKKNQPDLDKAIKMAKVRLPVPKMDCKNLSVTKWFAKYEKEAQKVGFGIILLELVTP